MAKKAVKKQLPPPPPSFPSGSDKEAPSPSIFPVKKLFSRSPAAVLRKHPDPSLKTADGEQEEEKEESSEGSGNAAPKRSHRAARRVSLNIDNANDLKLKKPSAATKTLAGTGSMADRPKENDESSESGDEESADEESLEDSGNAARQPNPLTQRGDSQAANDGKHDPSNTSLPSDSDAEDREEDTAELKSRSKFQELLPPTPSQPTRNDVNPILDPLSKPPGFSKPLGFSKRLGFSKYVDGGEHAKRFKIEEEEEESTANESSEDFCNTNAKEDIVPQPRDSQNMDDDKQTSNSSSSSGSSLGNGEEEPLSCKPVDRSAQPVEKEHNSRKQSATSHAQISKKKRVADIVGVEGVQEKERFKRIWSNEDELALLQGIMEYKERHHIIPYSHLHAESLLKSVKDSLSISVSVNQLNDKVRRMKRRFNNTTTRQNLAKKSKISDPHNAAVFDLSKKIWDSVKEEPILFENKITLVKKEDNINKKKRGLKHFAEEYPSLYSHLRSEHPNNALLLQNHIPIANAEKWEEKCKKLEMMDIELNMQKIELLSSAVKLIKDAFAKC